MSVISRKDLKPFQEKAVGELAALILEYPSPRFKRFDPDTGELLPFLCRLRAITGAGKTPILATVASTLNRGIVLWTTNRGAVISQTLSNLRPGGKYAELLPEGTQVFLLSEMSPADWEEAMSRPDSLTIMLATVASFNQDGDELRIHRKDGEYTRWEMLSGIGSRGRKRPLYVFYDEGHGATERQFRKLREIKPRAFVLASASPLPEDLADLLSGRTAEEREQSLADRTVIVPTRSVVVEGLLKNRLYFVDCNTAKADAVREANKKWSTLRTKLAPLGMTPIACFIVNDTVRGVDVWESLVALKVPPKNIAVHLNRAADVMQDRKGTLGGLIDTYTGKKTQDRSPETLRAAGYTHIIWNLTLREGWDEPLAYVAYLDQQGKSTTDIVQKIGRFVRQPAATPFEDPDLNAAYFYLNVTDEEFTNLIRATQDEMETEGYEVIGMSHGDKPPDSRTVPVRKKGSLPRVAPWFGDKVETRDAILLGNLPYFAEDALKSSGAVRTRVFDMANLAEDVSGRSEEARVANDVITPWEFLCLRLASIDSRIIQENGTIFSATLKDHKKMSQRMQYGSEAMTMVGNAIPTIVAELNAEFRLAGLGKHGLFEPAPFNLVSPDITGVSDSLREKYKVRRYKNAVHAEYNGLNPFEVNVAAALDELGLLWARNPATKHGYRVPIPALGADSIWFYPDFLLWTAKDVVLIDPKGKHLLEAAVVSKLLDMTSVPGLPKPIRIALILDGAYSLDQQGSWKKEGKTGFTLVRRTSTGPKAQRADNLRKLVQSLTG